MRTKNIATILAILAAALYAINVPVSKLLMEHISATMMAGLLYFGAGTGMLDIIAPILLMMGIANTNSANVSLLNNFEIVATSLIALIIFKEVISRKLWIAIGLVVVASAILSFEIGLPQSH